jgi:hypothetical protein
MTNVTTEVEHLDDLRRQLPDWLRAHTGWTEGALQDVCSATVREIGNERMGATCELDGSCVHVHLDSGRDLDLEASHY